jgi:F0F1-type ATP synthase assembly protein I
VGIDRRTSQLVGLAWGFGWRVVAGVILGFYLDGWLGTSPLFLVVLALGSLVAAVAELIRAAAPDPDGDPRRP